jgi:peptidoglycan hydrolase CwlO-like protein
LDWIYLFLITAFMIWSVQIYLVYARVVEKIQDQIASAQTSQEDVSAQAEEFEARAAELAEQLADLKSENDTLEKTEKGLKTELDQYRQNQEARRPTRHRVEMDGESN